MTIATTTKKKKKKKGPPKLANSFSELNIVEEIGGWGLSFISGVGEVSYLGDRSDGGGGTNAEELL